MGKTQLMSEWGVPDYKRLVTSTFITQLHNGQLLVENQEDVYNWNISLVLRCCPDRPPPERRTTTLNWESATVLALWPTISALIFGFLGIGHTKIYVHKSGMFFFALFYTGWSI